MHKRVNIAAKRDKLCARVGEMPRMAGSAAINTVRREGLALLTADHAAMACDGVRPQKIS